MKRKVLRRTSAAVVGALLVSVALSLLFAAGGHKSKGPVRAADGMFVMDDFESGALTGWRAVGGGSGGWFVYSNGSKAPDPAQSDPNVPFDFWYPPQGRFAAVTDMNGPGTLILYRDVKLDGRFMLQLTVFHASASAVSAARGRWPTTSPGTISSSGSTSSPRRHRSIPLAQGDVLENVFKTSTSDPDRREPTRHQSGRVALGGPDGTPSSRRCRQRRSSARRRRRHSFRADRLRRQRAHRASEHQGAVTRSEPRPAQADGSARR